MQTKYCLSIFCVGTWKVFITTGQYKPTAGNEERNNESEELNVNTDDEEHERGSNYISQQKRSLKYQVAPWSPVNQLFIVIYGDCGKTGLLPLVSDEPADKEKFLPGTVDRFKVIFLRNVFVLVKFQHIKYPVMNPNTKTVMMSSLLLMYSLDSYAS